MNSVKGKIKEGLILKRHAIFPFARGNTFAATHVLEELYEPDAYGNRNKWHKLSRQSIFEGWERAPEVFQDFFEREYLPSITFVNMGGMYTDAEIVVKVLSKDPSDAPTAQLKMLLARLNPAVFAVDHSLSKTGVAVSRKGMPTAARAGRQIDDGVSAIHAVTFGGAATVLAIDALLFKGASFIGLPRWVGRLVAIVGVGGALTAPELRSKIVKPFLPLVETLQNIVSEALEASAFLATEVIPLDSRDGIEQRIAEILVRYGTSEGMLAKDIREGLRKTSPHLYLPSISDIRGIISNVPCFDERRPYRYWFSSGRRPEWTTEIKGTECSSGI